MKQLVSVKLPGMRCMILGVTALSLIMGCSVKGASESRTEMAFTTEYQAVFLDNGQAFFGKVEHPGADYLLLEDVFYIQRQVNQDTNEVKNILIKRGSEWHGPDLMYINNSHIVLIEPVAAGSQVAKLIKEAQNVQPKSPQ